MRTETLEICRDGLTLRGFQSLPETDSYDVAIIFHGFLMTCGRNPEDLVFQVSEELNARGIGTVRMDFAGQGESDGKSEDMSVLSEILDASAIVKYVETLPGIRNIYVYGQSQGAVVAAMIAGAYSDRISKAALSAPAATIVEDAKKGNVMGTPFDPDNIPDKMTLLGQNVGGFYFRANRFLNIYDWAKNYEGPTVIVHSQADPIVSYHYAEKFHDLMRNSTLHILPGGNHSMKDDVRKETIKLICDHLEN